MLFRREDFGAAAAAWREVLDRATAAGVTLPEPVELNLARALKLSGADRDARAVLEEYLRTAADGPWAVEAEEMLRRL